MTHVRCTISHQPAPRTQTGTKGRVPPPRRFQGIPFGGGRQSAPAPKDTYVNWQYAPVRDTWDEKEPFLNKQKESKETTTMKQKYMEGFSKLMEQDLDQAELLLAAKDMVDRLQKMAEDVASMQVEDLMSLVEAMRDQFGVDKADAFNTSVESTLQGTLDNIKNAHDSVDTAIKVLQGEEVGNDMGDMPIGDMEPEMTDTGDMAGSEPAAGPEEEPTAREKKDESFESVQKSLFDAINEGQLGKGVLRNIARKIK